MPDTMPNEYFFYPTSTAPVGYTCTCGAWVVFGATHSCSPPMPVPQDRLVEALERIAGLLERLVENKSL